MMRLTTVLLAIVTLGCHSTPSTNIIEVEITPNILTLENRQIKKNQFESELKAVVGAKIKKGFQRKDLTVNLRVDDRTKRGDIVDLETAMRRANVRKVLYSSFDSDEQVLLRLD